VTRFSGAEQGGPARFSEIEMRKNSVSVRRETFPAWLVAVAGAARCGPLVALDDSSLAAFLVVPDTSYPEFARCLG